MALRKLVSGDKFRLKEGNYDFDLTYITQNIIAMGLPGENIASIWRNDSNEVSKFLNKKHGRHYLIFNLSGEKYDYKSYNYQVRDFSFPDHHAPALPLLVKIVEDMFAWLSKDASNVVVVHCLAGRSRTGTVIAALLLYGGYTHSADEAIRFFNAQRSQNENGVVLPSQIRYVNYFEQMMHTASMDRIIHSPKKVFLKEIVIEPVPAVEGGGKRSSTGGALTPVLKIEELEDPQRLLKKLTFPSYWRSDERARLDVNLPLQGDVQIKFVHFSKNPKAFTKTVRRVFSSTLLQAKVTGQYPHVTLFRFSFNTSFIADNAHLVLGASELDAAYAGSIAGQSFVPDNLQVHFYFAPMPADASNMSNTRVVRSRPASGPSYSPPTPHVTSLSPNLLQLRPHTQNSPQSSRVSQLPVTPYTTDVINVTRETPMSMPPNTARRLSDPIPYSPPMVGRVQGTPVNNTAPTANIFPTALSMQQTAFQSHNPVTPPFNGTSNSFTMNVPNANNINNMTSVNNMNSFNSMNGFNVNNLNNMNSMNNMNMNSANFNANNIPNNVNNMNSMSNMNSLNNITNSMSNMQIGSVNMNYNNPVNNTPPYPFNNTTPQFNSFTPIGPSATYTVAPNLPLYTPPNTFPNMFPTTFAPNSGNVLPQPQSNFPMDGMGYPNPNPFPY